MTEVSSSSQVTVAKQTTKDLVKETTRIPRERGRTNPAIVEEIVGAINVATAGEREGEAESWWNWTKKSGH